MAASRTVPHNLAWIYVARMHRVGRFCHRNRRFVFSAATVIATAASVPDISSKSRCSGASSSSETSSTAAEVTLTIVVNDDDTKDAEWEIEKEKCSFCKQFLQSPCKHEFRRWSKCVDMAKEKDIDFVKACSVYTNALMVTIILSTDFLSFCHLTTCHPIFRPFYHRMSPLSRFPVNNLVT